MLSKSQKTQLLLGLLCGLTVAVLFHWAGEYDSNKDRATSEVDALTSRFIKSGLDSMPFTISTTDKNHCESVQFWLWVQKKYNFEIVGEPDSTSIPFATLCERGGDLNFTLSRKPPKAETH